MITRFNARGATVFYHLTCIFQEYYFDILAQNIIIAYKTEVYDRGF